MIKDNYGDDVIARFADLLIFIAPSYLCLCFLADVHGYTFPLLLYQKSVGIIHVRL